MGDAAAKLLEQVMALPLEDRREIGERLLESGEGGLSVADDPELMAEIIRRSDEAHAHPDSLLDGEEVMKNLREHLQRKRGQ